MLKNDSHNIYKDDLYKIPSSEITVIIQGLLYRDHQEGDKVIRAISSIRHHLPEAEIIISTWSHQSVDGLKVDKVIISSEPKCFEDENGNVNNILRQIVSTQNGIKAATRSYILKFRADHVLLNANITTLREYSSTVPSHKRFFNCPVTVTNLFVRDPVRVPMLFHLSDLVQFGCKQDLLNLWSISMPAHNDLYFAQPPKWRIWGRFNGYTSMRQVPEQTLMLGWLAKQGVSIHLPHVCYSNYSLFKLSEELLTNHFFIMNWENSGIQFPQRFHINCHYISPPSHAISAAFRSISGTRKLSDKFDSRTA